MNDEQRAERRSKQEERARDGRKAMTEYEVQALAVRAKTERLKALRLASRRRPRSRPPSRPSAAPRVGTNNSSLHFAALFFFVLSLSI
jgi:hypothetical protein